MDLQRNIQMLQSWRIRENVFTCHGPLTATRSLFTSRSSLACLWFLIKDKPTVGEMPLDSAMAQTTSCLSTRAIVDAPVRGRAVEGLAVSRRVSGRESPVVLYSP